MSKPSSPKRSQTILFPAVFIGSIAIVAIMALTMTAGSAVSSLRRDRTDATVMFPASSANLQQRTNVEQRTNVRATMEALPLAFEANQGQTDPQVKYLARANGYTLFLTGEDAVFSLHSATQSDASPRSIPAPGAKKAVEQSDSVMHLHLVGSNSHAKIEGLRPLPGHSNYFIGDNPNQWQTNVPQYARVAYDDVYPGVNLAFYGAQRQLEFDFIVARGADASRIELSASGANGISTDDRGNLILAANAGSVTLHKPVAYQERNGQREPVEARFVIAGNNRAGEQRIGFELGNYDHSRELVIDPSVAFATYLGGNAEDDGIAIALDSSGNAYVTGQTSSTNFTNCGCFQGSNAGGFDAFVTKIAANGSSVLYSTYVGGLSNDSGNAIAVDSTGDAFVAGGTQSSNFPINNGAFQPTLKGLGNAFVFELAASGDSLTYSTYLGGSSTDSATGLALDSSGEAYVVGSAASSDFPTTAGSIQPKINGASNGFVTKLSSTGASLVYSTYLGGGSADNASGVAVDAAGNAYVTGETFNSTFPVTSGAFQTTCGTSANCNGGISDAFVSVINPTGSAFVYSTFLGGEAADVGFAIAVDSTGDAYVTGYTRSTLFPTKSAIQPALKGSQDAFVTELNPSGSALVFSTYLGGSTTSGASSIAVDSGGDVYVTGSTASSDFPTANATQSAIGGLTDAFLSEIVPNSTSLYFSTFLGGTQNENTGVSGGSTSIIGAVAVDPAGANIYLTGNTASGSDFPLVNAGQGTYGGPPTDAFVAKYTQAAFTISATTPAAVNPGSSSSSTVTLTSLNGYNSAVTLTCTVSGSGSPLPGCGSISTNPVTPTSGGATATVMLTTTAPGAKTTHRAGYTSAVLWIPVASLGLTGIFFVPARRKRVLGFLFLALALTVIFFLPSCGNSYGGGGGGGNSCAAVPNAPTGLAASNTTSTGTTLNWTAPTSLGAYCTLSNYTIYNNTSTVVGTSTTTSFNATGLTPSTPYSFTVAASDQKGMSLQSSAASVTTGSAGTPAGNYTVTVTGTDANHVTRSTQVTLTVN